VAALEFVAAADIVDADEEGLLAAVGHVEVRWKSGVGMRLWCWKKDSRWLWLRFVAWMSSVGSGGVVNDVADHCPINSSGKTRRAPPACMRDCILQTAMRHIPKLRGSWWLGLRPV